jgi:hypothetical protein
LEKDLRKVLAKEKSETRDKAFAKEYTRLKEVIEEKDKLVLILKMVLVFVVGYFLFYVVVTKVYDNESSNEAFVVNGLHYDVCIQESNSKLNTKYFDNKYSKLYISKLQTNNKSFIKLGSFKSLKRAKILVKSLRANGLKSTKIVPMYGDQIITIKQAKQLVLSNLSKSNR